VDQVEGAIAGLDIGKMNDNVQQEHQRLGMHTP
jgi:hypothetical protein